MDALLGAAFWIGLFKIVWIDIILSGDNAVVIALATRGLPAEQQRKAVMFGSGAAVLLRVALTVIAAKLMQLPFVEVIGGLLLLWIGMGLLRSEDDAAGSGNAVKQGMLAAVRTILLADFVMSLDNVIAVAAAAADSGSGHQHSAGGLWLHADDQAHGALPDHRDSGGGADWLGGW